MATWPNVRVRDAWLIVHIVLVLAGYAALLLTAVASIFYLIQERRLKSKKRTSTLLEKLPPLAHARQPDQRVDGARLRAADAGRDLRGDLGVGRIGHALDRRRRRIQLSLFTWLLCLVMIFLRASAGWRGRKAAVMALVVLGCSALTWVAHVGLRPALDTMKLLLTGLNHRTAPVEVRERLAFEETGSARSAGQLEAASGTARRHDSFHLQSRGSHGRRRRSRADAEDRGRAFPGRIAQRGARLGLAVSVSHDGPDAIRHLFRVASSLDSMIVGEPQILGQLKNAYALRQGVRRGQRIPGSGADPGLQRRQAGALGNRHRRRARSR